MQDSKKNTKEEDEEKEEKTQRESQKEGEEKKMKREEVKREDVDRERQTERERERCQACQRKITAQTAQILPTVCLNTLDIGDVSAGSPPRAPIPIAHVVKIRELTPNL